MYYIVECNITWLFDEKQIIMIFFSLKDYVCFFHKAFWNIYFLVTFFFLKWPNYSKITNQTLEQIYEAPLQEIIFCLYAGLNK